MKDKRTRKEKDSHKEFIKEQELNGFVLCQSEIEIMPPTTEYKYWILVLRQGRESLVVGWYRSERALRKHVEVLRNLLPII